MFNIYFPSFLPSPSYNLPLTLISLEEWSLITIKGFNAIKYIQNQLTCNINSLSNNKHCFSAHCNNKGKVIGCMSVFYYKNNISYIIRKNIKDNQIKNFKKYDILSEIKIDKNEKIILLGLAGLEATITLNKIFKKIPNLSSSVIKNKDTTIIYYHLPSPRYILITTLKTCNILIKKLKNIVIFNNSKQWLALDIEAGYPIIDLINSEKFIPQTININKLEGISFNKGCYIGQEIIAKTEYLNINKKTLYLVEINKLKYIPKLKGSLKIKKNKYLNRIGKILTICILNNGNIWLQIILNKKFNFNKNLLKY